MALRGFSPWGPVGSVGGWTGVLQSVRLWAEASCPGLRAVWSPFFALIPVASMGCVPTLRALVLPTQLCHRSPLISHPLSPCPVSLGSFPFVLSRLGRRSVERTWRDKARARQKRSCRLGECPADEGPPRPQTLSATHARPGTEGGTAVGLGLCGVGRWPGTHGGGPPRSEPGPAQTDHERTRRRGFSWSECPRLLGAWHRRHPLHP